MLITALTTAALTTILNTGIYQVSFLYSSVTVSGIVWNILITAPTTAALTTILNTGLYQVSFNTPL
jgi:hypothetical protein